MAVGQAPEQLEHEDLRRERRNMAEPMPLSQAGEERGGQPKFPGRFPGSVVHPAGHLGPVYTRDSRVRAEARCGGEAISGRGLEQSIDVMWEGTGSMGPIGEDVRAWFLSRQNWSPTLLASQKPPFTLAGDTCLILRVREGSVATARQTEAGGNPVFLPGVLGMAPRLAE